MKGMPPPCKPQACPCFAQSCEYHPLPQMPHPLPRCNEDMIHFQKERIE